MLLLVSNEGALEERLAAAYFSHLEPIDAAELPLDVRLQFEWIRSRLSDMFAGPGKINGVNRTTAVLIAQHVVLLHYSLKWRNDNGAL